MFDQLGWADNDPRTRYEITVALDSFVPWLRGHRRDLADSFAHETMEMTAITHDMGLAGAESSGPLRRCWNVWTPGAVV